METPAVGRVPPRGANSIPTDNLQMHWITGQDAWRAVRPNASLGSGACDRRLGTRVRGILFHASAVEARGFKVHGKAARASSARESVVGEAIPAAAGESGS